MADTSWKLDQVTEHDLQEVAGAFRSARDKADNRLEPAFEQGETLQRIGFAHADCWFKWFELAVFGGVKP
ncbi:hypothetical protein [Paenibacillus sp. B01]|uniref:hypothetical protein n=1 Tax=Paenibacillus sp. B01 TaxID=2660554 RepID=UPI00129BEBCB|nr:hypothetical protein [Paenibacillus sp. B01]QGG54811.1 hypothetical protein GE073_03890 [Paenibacillus sp. B01]